MQAPLSHDDETRKASPAARVNVADRLASSARKLPGRLAVVAARPKRGHRPLAERYSTIRFADLDSRADNIARGLVAAGVVPGTRLALLVRPGVDFVALVFGVLRSGAIMVLVDAGLGRRNIVDCLAATAPQGFIGIPQAQLLRLLFRRRFPQATTNITVGRRWGWRGPTLADIEQAGSQSQATLPTTLAADPAAIVFTSGSTGPPKGVEYCHATFATQLAEIERMYGLAPGGVDLACFPLFGLFNVALGITTVLPEMDFSRPASCDPAKLLAAAGDWQVTQSFASPAVWDRVSRYCQQHGVAVPTLQQVFSCGAPVTQPVIDRTLSVVARDAALHTPYGATECLPISTISASELGPDVAAATASGAGVCVGRRVDSIEWRLIKISDQPIATLAEAAEVDAGEVGELVVCGPQVSRRYVALGSERANALAKIADGTRIWHRTGDVGYFDQHNRFWYCGRKSQRVVIDGTTLFTECVEGIVNAHADVRRSALVGVDMAGRRTAVIVVESEASWSSTSDASLREWMQQHAVTRPVSQLLLHRLLPTDIRHNSKIRREELARWAQKRLQK